MVTHESGGHHHPPSGFIRKYIFSLDHKVIGIQYYVLALFSVFVGMALSLLMRIHLVWPSAKMPFTPGGQMTPEQYLALLTMHGSIMIFMVLTTAPQSGFGNFILPIQIGAEDMAFPVLNMLSFWVTFLSLVVLISAFFVTGGAPIVVLAYYGDTRAAGFRRTARRMPAVVARPGSWDELLHSGRPGRDRYSNRFAYGWFAAAMAAPVLVLRPP